MATSVMDMEHRLAFQRFFKTHCPSCGNVNFSQALWRCATPDNGGCGFITSPEVVSGLGDVGNGSPALAKLRAKLVEEALAWQMAVKLAWQQR